MAGLREPHPGALRSRIMPDEQTDDAWTRLGAFFRARREELGLTQQELAERTGILQGVISYHERGHRWSLEYIPIYRAALGLTQREVLRAVFPNGDVNGPPLRLTWEEYIEGDPILDDDMKDTLKRLVLVMQRAALTRRGDDPPEEG